jgi:mannose-6-phosphate isomerase-like protein (cupin superfamily)
MPGENVKVASQAYSALIAVLAVSAVSAQTRVASPETPVGIPIPPAGTIRIPDLDAKDRGPIRPVDLATFPPNAFRSEFVAGPTSGLNSGYLVVSRVPPGVSGPALHTHSTDQLLFTLKGEMTLQLGADVFKVRPETLVLIPANTPHRNWNTGAEEEVHLEIIAPPTPRNALTEAAEPRKIPNVESLFRRVADMPIVRPRDGVEYRWLARRQSGSLNAGVHYDETKPDAARQATHIHAFDQAFFVIDGTMHVKIGVKDYEAGPYSYVVLPAGTVHQQWATGTKMVKHLNIQLPAPDESGILDIPVEIKAVPDRR